MKSIQANETKLMETCQKKLRVFFCPNGAREKPSPSCEGGGVTGLYFLHCETCRFSSCNKHFVSFFPDFFFGFGTVLYCATSISLRKVPSFLGPGCENRGLFSASGVYICASSSASSMAASFTSAFHMTPSST